MMRKDKPVGEDGLRRIRRICKEHQAAEVNGVEVDAASACLIASIADGLNPKNRRKFLGFDVATMGHVAWDIAAKRGGVKFSSR